jgi:hypothetical protein
MKDESKESRVLGHIQKLVSEEHHLFGRPSLSDEQTRRLTDIQTELDQCWDLLRQRRALRETGQDPSGAHVRPADVVKKYTG